MTESRTSKDASSPASSAGISSAEVPFGRIVACMDGSEIGDRIFPHALAMARALGAPLTLLRVLEGKAIAEAPHDPLAWDIRRRESREQLERMAERDAGAGSIDTEVIEGQAAEEICRWARHHRASLTVLCSHGGSGETEWSLASTARKLVEGAPASFLLVPAAAVSEERVARYQRLLVPLDGSPRAESVLPIARRLAEACDAELLLAHVVPIPELTEIGPLDAEDLELREQLARRNERVASEYLDRLRSQLASSQVRVRALVLRGGDARTRLARVIVEQEVDLVVLSAQGRTARADVPLGTVTAYLVAHATKPMLIVRRLAGVSTRRAASAAREDVRLPSQATS